MAGFLEDLISKLGQGTGRVMDAVTPGDQRRMYMSQAQVRREDDNKKQTAYQQVRSRPIVQRENKRLNSMLDQGRSFEDISTQTGMGVNEIRSLVDYTRPGYGVKPKTALEQGAEIAQNVGKGIVDAATIIPRQIGTTFGMNSPEAIAAQRALQQNYKQGVISAEKLQEEYDKLGMKDVIGEKLVQDDQGNFTVQKKNPLEFTRDFTNAGVDTAGTVVPFARGATVATNGQRLLNGSKLTSTGKQLMNEGNAWMGVTTAQSAMNGQLTPEALLMNAAASYGLPFAGAGTANVARATKKEVTKNLRKQEESLYRAAAQDKILTRVEPHYIQPSQKKLDQGIVSQHRAAIINGNIDPIIVTQGPDGRMKILDGEHRYQAYMELGVPQIPTRVVTPAEVRMMKQGGYASVPGTKGILDEVIAKPSGERQLSRLPNKMMEQDNTAPIHTELLRNSTYEVKKNKDVIDATSKAIEKDEVAALRFAKQGTTTEANATSLQLLDKYLAEGRIDEANDLVKTVMPRFTRQGQETQILSIYSKQTPAGAVKLANNLMDKSAKNAPKMERLENDTVAASKQFTAVNKEATDIIAQEIKTGRLGGNVPQKQANLSPEERLAKRINATKDATKKANDPITDMVNTLHGVAKEVLPNKGKTPPRNPMELVGLAIKNKAEYADIWLKAKEIVAEKYKGNDAALAELDDYFAKQLDKPFNQKQVNKGVQNGLKDVDLGKIVKQHYSVADEAGRDLKARLIKEAGLTDAEAGQLAASIQARFTELTKAKKESILKQMFGEKTTPEQKTAADRIIEMSNLGALGRDDLRPLVAKRLKMDELSSEATAEIARRAQALQELPDGSPERLRATAEMMQYIAKQVPSGTLDKVLGTWTAGLISGLKTVTGAPASNTTNALLGAATNPIAAGLDATRSAITGAPRSNTIVSPKNYLQGFKKGLPEAGRYLKTGIDERSPVGDMQRELNFKNKTVEKGVNGVFRVMAALDRPFYYGAKAQGEAEFAKLNRLNKGKTEKLTDLEKTEAIEHEARKSVLDYDTLLSKVAAGMKQAAERSDTAFGRGMGKVATTINSPFVRIPSAGLSRMVDFSPVGAPIHALRQAAEMKYGSQKDFNWRDMNKAVAESSTGLGVVVLGYALASSDKVSGEYPSNDSKEQARWAAERITPNSVKIGNDWVSLNYLGPVGSLIQQGKRFADSRKEGKGIGESAFIAEAGLGRDALNQSYLQGINNSLEASRDPERHLAGYAKGLASSTIPAIVNDASNLTDGMQRQVDTLGDAMMNRTPLRHFLKEKQDTYGNSLEQRTDPVRLTVDPLKPSTAKDSPVLSEVRRLHLVDKQDENLQVTPTKLKKTISIGEEDATGKNIQTKLTDTQRYDIQKAVGQSTQKAWGDLIKTDKYKALDDRGKAKALKDLREVVSEAEQHRYAMANNLGQYKKDFAGKKEAIGKDAQKYMSEGLDISKFAKATSEKSGTGSSTEVAPTLAKNYKKTLEEFDALDTAAREQKFYKENDAEFRYEAAKYENKKASGTLTQAETIKAEDKLAKLQAGSKFSKETRDLYSLSKKQLSALIDQGKITEKQAGDILAYGDALKDIDGYNKFKDKNGNVAFAPKGRGGGRRSSGGRKGTGKGKAKGGAGSKKQLPSDDSTSTINLVASLSKKVANTKVAKRQIPKTGGISAPGIKAYKKVAKTKVSMTRKA